MGFSFDLLENESLNNKTITAKLIKNNDHCIKRHWFLLIIISNYLLFITENRKNLDKNIYPIGKKDEIPISIGYYELIFFRFSITRSASLSRGSEASNFSSSWRIGFQRSCNGQGL